MGAAENVILQSELLDRRQRLQSAMATLPDSTDLVRLLHDVDTALDRINDGSYGLCEFCKDPIEKELLAANPLSCFCIDHLSEKQRRALEQDLELAGQIQNTLLPNRNLKLGGWEACYHYQPAGPVSGDYCDLVRTPTGNDGEFLFLAGDVSGKGIAASLLMTHLHAIIRSLLPSGLPPHQLLERANRVFCESRTSAIANFYATLLCGSATSSGKVEVSNAGHCPLVLVTRNGTTTVAANGLPIGLFCDSRYSGNEIQLDPGDSLVIYTDGLTEAENQLGEEYGTDRLLNILNKCHGMAAQATGNACLADVETFLSGVPKKDDLTIMVIQRTMGLQ